MKFVQALPTIYEEEIMSLNMHNLIHMCDDIETTGCSLNEISAFCFESYLGGISAVLRSPTNLVSQYCQRMMQKETFTKKKSARSSEVQILMKKKQKIIKIKYKDCIVSTSHPNNLVLLQDNTVAQVCELSMINGQYYATVKKYKKTESLFKEPCDS